MIVVLGILGPVIALFAIAGVIDLKARRRGGRYRGGDRTVSPREAAARAEVSMRDNSLGSSGGF